MSWRGSSAESSSSWAQMRLATASSTSWPSTTMRWCSSRADRWSSKAGPGGSASIRYDEGLVMIVLLRSAHRHARRVQASTVAGGSRPDQSVLPPADLLIDDLLSADHPT